MLSYGVFADCQIPTEDMSITNDTTLCPGTYYLNDTNTNGVLIWAAHDIVLDCNGAILDGNDVANSMGIYNNGYDDLIVKNCTLVDYVKGIEFRNSDNSEIKNSSFINNSKGITLYWGGISIGNITDNYFYNNTYAGVWLYGSSVHDLNITNNTFYEDGGILEENTLSNAINISIKTNRFYNGTSIIQQTGTDWDIINNYFYGAKIISSYGVRIDSNNTLISGNYFEYYGYTIELADTYNITIYNNTINNTDFGIWGHGSRLINISNNIFTNQTQNYDQYDVGLKLNNVNNSFIINNNFTEIGTTAILLQGTYNTTIENNYIDLLKVDLIVRGNYLAQDGTDVPCGIKAVQRYKSWLPHFGNDNVTLSNNIFSANTQCYLHTENISQLSHDLSSYWYRHFITPTVLKGDMEFYIPNTYQNLSRYTSSQGIRNDIWSNADGGDNKNMTYSIFFDYLFFDDVSTIYSYQTNIYNLTNALVYNPNGTAYCTNVNSCDGNINITLAPNNASYVLENFNITYVSDRDFSPVNLTTNTVLSNVITSVLNESINATVILNSQCGGTAIGNLKNISYTSGTTPTTVTYTSSQWSCSDDVITFTLNDIEKGINTLTMNYYSSTEPSCIVAVSIFSDFIGFGGLIVLAVILFGLYSIKKGKFNVDIKDYSDQYKVILFIVIMLIFAMIMVQNMLGC